MFIINIKINIVICIIFIKLKIVLPFFKKMTIALAFLGSRGDHSRGVDGTGRK